MSIRDAAGDPLTYWPISGLEAGEDSQHLIIAVDTPQDAKLRAEEVPGLIVFGRVAGTSGPFIDLVLFGIDLSVLSGPETSFEIYASAAGTITSVAWVALFCGVSECNPAGWFA